MSIFRNVFQGGVVVEVFSPVTKNLFSDVFIAKNAKKVYDKSAKTLIYVFDGESTEKQVVIPKDSKKSLGLVQPYLILQLFRSGEKGFRFEIRVNCKNGSRRRIAFSTHKADIQVSTLSASIPFKFYHKSAWMHVCFSVYDIVLFLWNEHCQSIDEITLGGSFSIRQIYTVHKDIIISDGPWEKLYTAKLPKQFHFPLKVAQVCHLISKHFLEHTKGSTPNKISTKEMLSRARSSDCNHAKRLSGRVCVSSEKANQSNHVKGLAIRAGSSSEGIVPGNHAKGLPCSSSTQRITAGESRINLTKVQSASNSKIFVGDAENTKVGESPFHSSSMISSTSAPFQVEKETNEVLKKTMIPSCVEIPGHQQVSFYDGVENINNKFLDFEFRGDSSCYQMSKCRNLNFDVQDKFRNQLFDADQYSETEGQLSNVEDQLSEKEDEFAGRKHLEVWLPSTSMDLSAALSLARNLEKISNSSCRGDNQDF